MQACSSEGPASTPSAAHLSSERLDHKLNMRPETPHSRLALEPEFYRRNCLHTAVISGGDVTGARVALAVVHVESRGPVSVEQVSNACIRAKSVVRARRTGLLIIVVHESDRCQQQ